MSAIQSALRGVRRVIKSVVHRSIAPLAVRAFRAEAAACQDPERALDLAEAFHYGRIRITPMQVRSEVVTFLEFLTAPAPGVVLEIGTANGGTLFLFSRVAAPDALLISVDLPGGRFGGGYPAWKAKLYKEFARASQTIELVRADSHDPATVAWVSRLLKGRKVDLLFIDADHSYSGVRSDFEMYSPLVRPGGVVAFHDIVPGPEAVVGGVARFWQELKARERATEIVADWDQGGYGIGIVVMSGAGASSA